MILVALSLKAPIAWAIKSQTQSRNLFVAAVTRLLAIEFGSDTVVGRVDGIEPGLNSPFETLGEFGHLPTTLATSQLPRKIYRFAKTHHSPPRGIGRQDGGTEILQHLLDR